MSENANATPGPWTVSPYGRIGYEIQGGGRSLAVVNRVGEKRLEQLDRVRSKAATNGEPAHQAEREACELEAGAKEALANAQVMAAATEMLEALQAAERILWMAEKYAEGGGSGGPEQREYDEAAPLIRAAIARAEGRP